MTEKINNDESDDDSELQKQQLAQRLGGIGAEHVSINTAAAVDLFKISKRLKISKLPKNAVVKVHSEGQPSISFYHDSKGNYELLSEDNEGKIKRVPVEVSGSSATPNTMFEPGTKTITQGGYLQYGIVHQFKMGQDEGVPDAYKLLSDPATLNPKILQDNISMGLVVRGEDNSLLWNVVDAQPPVGPVTSAVVMHEQGLHQAL